MAKQHEYTARDVGQYIDGALGEEHAVEKMADLLGGIESTAADDLLEEYDDGTLPEEERDEWLDDATEVLQDATDPALTWVWEAGDLILTDEKEEG